MAATSWIEPVTFEQWVKHTSRVRSFSSLSSSSTSSSQVSVLIRHSLTTAPTSARRRQAPELASWSRLVTMTSSPGPNHGLSAWARTYMLMVVEPPIMTSSGSGLSIPAMLAWARAWLSAARRAAGEPPPGCIRVSDMLAATRSMTARGTMLPPAFSKYAQPPRPGNWPRTKSMSSATVMRRSSAVCGGL